MIKRIVALTLALMIAVSVLAFSASAEDVTGFEVPDEAVISADSFDKTDADIAATGVTLDDPLVVPRVVVTTENGNGTTLQKEDGYQNATISITDTDGSVLSDVCSIKVRGNKSAMAFVEKKGYTFKFESKKDVLGMGKAKKWALIANVFDPTMLRNYMGYELAKELDLPYTSEHQFVEVFLDGSYRGCYELTEPIQEGKTRVNIDIESNNGMKDFLLQFEKQRIEEGVSYITTSGVRFQVTEPDEPNEDQLTYISDTMNGIVDTLKKGTKEDISAVIDVPSFASLYLLNEYFKNMDFDMSSVFFFYQNGKLYAGPVWDYDMATGNTNPDIGSARAKESSKTDGIMQSKFNLYQFLCNKTWFMDEVKNVYEEHYDYITSLFADGGLLDTWSAENSEIFTRNGTVWRVSKWLYNYQKVPLSTYQANLEYLKNWLNERNAWLYQEWDLFSSEVYEYLRGDADGNGVVDLLDATTIQRSLAGLPYDDADGRIAIRAALSEDDLEITDSAYIQRFVTGIDNPYELNTRVVKKLRDL